MIPNNIPATRYLSKCHHECFLSDSLAPALSNERTSKSVFPCFITVSITCSCVFIGYNCKIYGRIKLAVTKPPAIKQQVATNDGHCKLDMPMMLWPEVQPPAYLVPKPIKKPPTIISKNPFKENKVDQLYTSMGESL